MSRGRTQLLWPESGQGGDRTPDTRIFSPVLYQLSYLSESSTPSVSRRRRQPGDVSDSPARFRPKRDRSFDRALSRTIVTVLDAVVYRFTNSPSSSRPCVPIGRDFPPQSGTAQELTQSRTRTNDGSCRSDLEDQFVGDFSEHSSMGGASSGREHAPVAPAPRTPRQRPSDPSLGEASRQLIDNQPLTQRNPERDDLPR